jgi:hypothetical protein
LINDAADATLALDALMFGPKPFKLVRTQGVDVTGNTLTKSSFKVNVFGQEGSVFERNSQEALVVYYGIVSTVDNFAGSPRVLGLRAEDIPNAIWELTPWSFIIDYFTNVGDLVNAVSFPKAAIKWVSKSTVRRRIMDKRLTSSLQENATLHPNVTSISSQESIMTADRAELNRYRSVPYPSTTFQWRLPGFGLKWLNIAALISSAKDFG